MKRVLFALMAAVLIAACLPVSALAAGLSRDDICGEYKADAYPYPEDSESDEPIGYYLLLIAPSDTASDTIRVSVQEAWGGFEDGDHYAITSSYEYIYDPENDVWFESPLYDQETLGTDTFRFFVVDGTVRLSFESVIIFDDGTRGSTLYRMEGVKVRDLSSIIGGTQDGTNGDETMGNDEWSEDDWAEPDWSNSDEQGLDADDFVGKVIAAVGAIAAIGVIGGFIAWARAARIKKPPMPTPPYTPPPQGSPGHPGMDSVPYTPEVTDMFGKPINENARVQAKAAEYQAANRESFNRSIERELQEDAARIAQQQRVDELMRIRSRISANSLKIDGTANDAMNNLGDRVRRMIDDNIENKTPVNPDALKRVQDTFKKTMSGKLLGEDEVPPVPGTAELMGQTAAHMFKSAAMNKSVEGVIIRGCAAYLTGGASEYAFAVAKAGYRMQDYVNAGGDSVMEGFQKAALGAVEDEIIGRGANRLMKGAGFPGKPDLSKMGKGEQFINQLVRDQVKLQAKTPFKAGRELLHGKDIKGAIKAAMPTVSGP